jgi:hypothetical protein
VGGGGGDMLAAGVAKQKRKKKKKKKKMRSYGEVPLVCVENAQTLWLLFCPFQSGYAIKFRWQWDGLLGGSTSRDAV